MTLLGVIFVLLVLLCLGAGVLAHRNSWSLLGGPFGWGRAAAQRLGPLPGAAVVAVVGYAATAVIGLGLGYLAKALESSVDKPVFRHVDPRVTSSKFTTANEKLTLLGNNANVQLVVLVGVIVLACALRRRWWIAVVGLALALEGEKYMQRFLGHTVDRGHPPTTLGTFPSGGVGRILAVYGVVIALVLLLNPTLSRAWRAGLWTGLATGAVVEAFTRVYLSKHWLTDALFGLPFGLLLLLTNVAVVAALATTRTAAPPSDASSTPGTDRVRVAG